MVDPVYRKVASSSLSRLVAHFWIFRLFMKGKFDAYVLVTFDQKSSKLVSRSVFTCQGILVSSRFQKYLKILMNLVLLGLLALSLKLFSSHDLALRIACISKECVYCVPKSKVPSVVRKRMLHKFPKKYPHSSFGKFEFTVVRFKLFLFLLTSPLSNLYFFHLDYLTDPV